MAQSQNVPTPPSRVWLLSIPRSGSHLLTKIFSQQSKLSYSGYDFMDYIFQHHKIMDQNLTLGQLSTEDRDALLKTAKDGLAKTKSIVDKIEAEVSCEEKENSPNLSNIGECLLNMRLLGPHPLHKRTSLLNPRPFPHPPVLPRLAQSNPLESSHVRAKSPQPNPPPRCLPVNFQTPPPDPPPSHRVPIPLSRYSRYNAAYHDR